MHHVSFLPSIDFKSKTNRLFIIISISLMLYPATSSAGSYLDDIQAEADQTTYLEKAQDEHKNLMNLEAASATDSTPIEKSTSESKPGELTVKFEEGLYREFPGNFIVYNRLSHEQKQEVISAYQKAENVKGIYRFGNSISLILKLASQ